MNFRGKSEIQARDKANTLHHFDAIQALDGVVIVVFQRILAKPNALAIVSPNEVA